MSKCIECSYYNLSSQYKRIINEMLSDYDKNDKNQYMIGVDDLRTIIDDFITMSMCKDDVKALVQEFGFFKALKLYQDTFGEFNLDERLDFYRTFGTLVYIILDDYIRDKELVIETY